MKHLKPLKTGTCPRCHGVDTNSEEDGGNHRCYHCQCGYVECADGYSPEADFGKYPSALPRTEDREP